MTKTSFNNKFDDKDKPITLYCIISPDNTKQQGENFLEFVRLINEQPPGDIAKLIIIDASYLRRYYDFKYSDSKNQKALFEWRDAHLKFINQFQVPCDVISWAELLTKSNERYQRLHSKITNFFAEGTDMKFRKIIENAAKQLVHRGTLKQTTRYVLEECAGFLLLVGYETYPGKLNNAIQYVRECDYYLMAEPPDTQFALTHLRSAYIFTPDMMFYFDMENIVKVEISPENLSKLKGWLGITSLDMDKEPKTLSEEQLQYITSISGHTDSHRRKFISYTLKFLQPKEELVENRTSIATTPSLVAPPTSMMLNFFNREVIFPNKTRFQKENHVWGVACEIQFFDDCKDKAIDCLIASIEDARADYAKESAKRTHPVFLEYKKQFTGYMVYYRLEIKHSNVFATVNPFDMLISITKLDRISYKSTEQLDLELKNEATLQRTNN